MQKAQIDTLGAVGKALGVDFVFTQSQARDGRYVGENGSYDRHSHVIRLDVNAGRNLTTDEISKTAIIRTAGHELTHYIEQNAAEGYRQLRNFMMQEYERRGVSFDELVKRQRQSFKLSESQAISEVIADGCEMMLQDTQAVQRLARKNRSLAQTIRDFIDEHIVQALKRAFTGVQAQRREARTLMDTDAQGMQHYAEELQALWDRALEEASAQGSGNIDADVAGNTQKSGNNDDVQYSLRDSEGNEIQIHESELRENKKTVATSTAVATIHEEDYQRFTGGNLVEEGTKYFRELGEKAVNPILGEVHLATSGLRHIVGRNNVSSIKAMTIPAIKPVIEQGQLVGLDERHNGKPIDTGIIAAKVSMPDGPYHVGVVVSQDNGGTRGQSNRYSFHAAYAIKESTAAMDSMEMNSTELPRERSSASVYSILREIAGYNTQSDEVQRSLREEAQTEDITAALQGRNAPLAIGDASGDITDTIPAYTELSATDASEDIVDENGLRDNGISGQNDVQYSLRDSEGNEYRITREEIEKNREEVAWMPVLEGVTGNAFPKMEGSKPSERILAYFQNLGGKAYRSEFGEIRLEKTGAEHFARFINQKTAAVVPLIPDVIENGSVVDVDENHKGTHVPTVSLAAKVAIDGKPYYMGVALRQIGQGDTRYYIHSVYAVNEENGDQLNLKGRAAGESRRPSTDDPHSLYSILQEIAGYNGTSGQNTEDTQYSQRDYEQMSVQDFVSAMAEDTGLREGEKGVLAHYNDLRRQAQSLQEKIAGATVEGQRRTWQRQLDNVNQRLQTMESSQGMVGLMQRARSAMDNLERLQSGQARHSLEEMGEQLGQLSRTMDALKAGNDQQARDILKDFERSYFTDRAKREAAQAIREASGSAMRLEDIEQAVGGIARAWYSHDESTAARAQELAEELMATIDYPNAQGSIGELIREQRGQVSIPVSREGMDYIRERWGSLKEANRQAGGIHVRFVARESVGYGADSAIQELGPDIVDLDAITSENDVIDYFMKAAEDTGFNREAWLTEKGVKDERELIPEVLSKIFEEVTGIQPKAGQLQAASLRGSLQSQSDYLNALTESLEGMREDMRRALKSGRGEMAELEGRLKRGQEDARAVMSYASAMVEENNRVSQSVIRSLESTVKSYEQMVADISGRAAQSYQEKLTWHDTMVANEKLHKSLERTLKRLDRMTRKGTDYDHVPEELRGVATAIMKYVAAFDESHERGLARLVNDRESAADILAQYSRMSVDSSYMDESVLELLEATKAAVDEYANVQGTRGAERAAAYNRAMTHLSQSLETLVGMINAGNEIFMNGRRVQTDRAAGQLEQELRQKKNAYQYGGAFKAIENAGRLFGSGNVTPYYFFKWQGGTLQALHEEFRRGQNAYGLRLDEAKNTIEDIMQRSGYANWGRDAAALQGRNLTFTTTWGENMTLSVEEQMTVLAAWEREHSGKQVLTEHLEKGGIVRLDDKSKTGIRRGVERQGMAVSAGMIEQIRNNLTAEQLQYMHEMVRFLSTTVGGWGNEASMRMFGYRKFTEANYFPFKVWKGAMKQGSNAQNLGLAGGAQTSSPHLVNSGMTKNLQNRASNPLVLQSFTDIVLEHTANMLTYSTMAAPIESMNRVLNVKTTGMMEGDNTAQAGRTEGGIVNEIRNGGTIRTLLAQKLGDNRANWLFNYMRDLQGGMQSDSREKAFDKLLSAFKKGAVSGSLSVSMKQPVSYIRAAYEISPRYLAEAIALPKSHFRDSYSEARQYAGVAAIKDMGRYDTSVGWGTAEWLGQTPEGGDSRLRSLWNGMREAVGYDANGKRLSWRTFADRWDAIAGYLPGKMDELTWNRLWEAVKLEQAAQNRGMDTQSEEFLKKCGERFTEVIDATQVYDSTMSRSDNMRSKSSLMKAMTSFMAEPTVNLNMLADAVISKKPKKMAAAASIYLLSAAVQALITAHFGVIRGDDREKEETYWEKLMDRLGGALGDEVNPLGSIPGASDLYEMLLNGEEVSRSDLTILNDIGKYGAKLMKGDYSGDLHSAYMGVEQLGGSLAKLVGLPTRNVMRDVRALWNWLAPNEEGTWLTGNGAVRENSESTMKLEFVNGWHDTWNNKYVTFYDTSSSAYVQRYYEALKAGRTQEAEELHEYLLIGEKKQEKTIGTQLGTILKKEYSSGSITLEEGLKFSEEHGVWDTEKKAYEALIKAKQKAETEMDEEETEAPSVYRTVFEAMTKDKETFGKAVEELAEHGYEEKNVISQAKSELGKGYREGRYTRTEAENILRDIFEVEEADERYWQIDKWNYQQETGTAEGYSKTGRLQEAMEKGTDKEYRIAKQELTANGYSEKDILSATKGIIKELYTKGTWSKSKTETALKNYKVTDGKNENYWLLKEWDYDMNKGKKDPNFSKYTEIRQAVKEGDWKSFNKAKSELQTYSTAKDEKTNNTNIVTQGISYWKEEYQALRRTDPQGAEKLWGNIAKALEAFGKSRRDIEKKKKEWEKED